MNLNSFTQQNFSGEYVSNRLQSRKDDRCDSNKLMNDARLRGQLGKTEANKIINMIDDFKSRK